MALAFPSDVWCAQSVVRCWEHRSSLFLVLLSILKQDTKLSLS